MAEQLPTASEAFGSTDAGQLPTVSEAFSGIEEGGLLHRMVPSRPAAQRIYEAFTGSVSRAFGDEPLTDPGMFALSPETQQALRKAGVWNDYEQGQKDFFAEHRERAWKAMAGTLNTTIRAGEAALAAPIGVMGQFLEDTGLLSKEDFEGAIADPGVLMAAGPFGEPMAMMANARRAANLRVEIPKSRAFAVIGEGNEGFFEARPLIPENAQARVEAAREAGIPAPVPEPVAPDVHVLARRVNPPAFERYDAFEAAKGAHRETIQTLAAAREALPEAVQAQDEIRTILGKVHGVEERLTKAARGRLEAAQARLDAVLSQDTPEMARARKALLEADIAQRDLVPEVASAYRQAREMMPPIEKRVAEVTEELSAGKLPEEMGLPPTKEVRAPDIAAADSTVTPPKVTGFKTAKGSTYKVGEGGKTTRDKAARPEHPGEQGPQPTAETTFYVDEAGLSALGEFQAQGMGNKAIVQHSSGQFGVKYLEGANAGKFERRTLVAPQTEPEVGLYPVELWKGGTRVHFGNKITEITVEEPVRPSPRSTPSRAPLQGTGPLRTRGLSESIESSAIESNLTQSFGDLPEYHQLSMADQARRATEFVAAKPDEALAVALGEKAAPKGLSPASVLVLVEKQAQAAGDVETLRRLATESRLTTTATEAGRFIRILGERDPTSAAGAMHLVQEARRAALEKRNATALKDAAKEIRATMRKNAPTRDAWAQFISEIVCKE